MDRHSTSSDELLETLIHRGVIPRAAGWSIERAPDGLNSDVRFAVSPEDERRFTLRRTERAGRFDYEADLMTSVRECDGVPAIHLRQPEQQLLVLDYVPGESMPLDRAPLSAIEQLARCLACIHCHERSTYTIWPSIEPRSGTRRDLYQDRLVSLLTYPASSRELWPEVDARIPQLLDGLRSGPPGNQHWDERRFAPLHGDLSVENIIWNGDQVGLIDWEYARDGDPAEDIAYLITEQPVSDERVAAFWSAYIDAGGKPGIWPRVEIYAPLVALDSAVWWIDYLNRQGVDPHHRHEVHSRINLAWDLANR